MDAIDDYLRELAARLAEVLGAELVGVYAGGSYALGAYEPGRSDVDVAAVVRAPVSTETKRAIVEAIRHESLPCPARGLEFVLYPLATVREPTIGAGFELNLNTGRGMTFRADLAPGEIESHWFPIDRSILAQSGVALFGPPARDVFAPVPRHLVMPFILESMRWHSTGPAPADDAVLNACRSWRYAVEGVWSSKPAAGAWAVERLDAPELVVRAREARRGDARLDPGEVERFVRTMLTRIESAGF